MLRHAALVLASALALAACNPNAQKAGQDGAGGQQQANGAGSGAFPNLLGASYRAEGVITSANGHSVPVVMIRSGGKMRMEMSRGDEGNVVIINNSDTHEAFSIFDRGGHQMAMRMDTSSNELANPVDMWRSELGESTPTGPCTHAGQVGSGWRRDKNGTPRTVCVTNDGIILLMKEGERTTWDTTNVQRGPQDPALFALPAGVQVMDLSNMRGAAEAVQRMRAAQKGH